MNNLAYHDGSRSLQDRFDTRRLADRLGDMFLSRPVIDPDDRAFIERMDMFFLATADADGRPQCSYKGGDPGFVRVLDEETVAFPNYDGNGMYLSSACHPGVSQLPALHPPDEPRRALALRAAGGARNADPGLEASQLGMRRAAHERPGAGDLAGTAGVLVVAVLEQPEPGGLRACLAAGSYAELSQHGGDMMVNRLLRDHHSLGDLGVAQALGEARQHLKLAGREPGRVRSRPGPWSPRYSAHAALAKSAGDDRGRGPGAQPLQLCVRLAQ
jgi:hypothetical protein